jgi:hypothetical protein
MTKPTKFIRRDQWSKIQANRNRIADAQDRDEREAELIRALNKRFSAQRAEGVK